MNFNFNDSILYSDVLKSASDEIIKLYGIQVRWIIPTPSNIDLIIGESNLNFKDNFHDVFVLPENAESYNNDLSYTQLGIQNMENLVVYVSADTIQKIHPNIVNGSGIGFDNIMGDLIIFQSGKILEVANITCNINGGLNHLFAYGDKKNVYKLTLTTYFPNKNNLSEVKNSNQPEVVSLKNLLDIFEIDKENKKEIAAEDKKLNFNKKKTSYNKKFGDL